MDRKFSQFLYYWNKNNIFEGKTADAVAYFVFYIVIPILVTVVGLFNFNTASDSISIAYFYITIMISSLNCIYDASNRKVEGKTVKNFKINLICIFSGVVSIYCFSEMLFIMNLKNISFRFDYILLAYFGVAIIGCYDFITCMFKDAALFEHNSE